MLNTLFTSLSVFTNVLLSATFYFTGLQVVVAQFYSERRIGRLCTGVFSLLLRDEAGNHRASADPYVFRLHRTDGSHILATHRYDRFFCRICVHQEDIRGRQDRLVKIIVVRVTLDGVNLVLFLF